MEQQFATTESFSFLEFLKGFLHIILLKMFHLFSVTRGSSPPCAWFARANPPPQKLVVPRIVTHPPPLYSLPQEGFTILRALVHSLLNLLFIWSVNYIIVCTQLWSR